MLAIRMGFGKGRLMSALGQKQTFAAQKIMSALAPIADMCSATWNVRLVPIADIRQMTRGSRKTASRRSLRNPKKVFDFSRRPYATFFRFLRQPNKPLTPDAGGEEWESAGERDNLS